MGENDTDDRGVRRRTELDVRRIDVRACISSLLSASVFDGLLERAAD